MRNTSNNASVMGWNCVNWSKDEQWDSGAPAPGPPEASRIFPCYPNNNGSQLNTHLGVFCLINYPTDDIIKPKFEAVIKTTF